MRRTNSDLSTNRWLKGHSYRRHQGELLRGTDSIFSIPNRKLSSCG